LASVSDLATLHKLIRHFEGCHLVPYLCPAGVWTCGWGSTGPDVFPGRAWTQAYADERLEKDARRFAYGTLALCPRLAGERLDAIADFAYNLGLARLKASTLRRKLNAGEYEAARAELRKWVYGGGKKLRGLVLRREAEAAFV
jgi:lysozyme